MANATKVSYDSHFNPRSRKGSDAACSKFRRYAQNFNPRSRKGSDVFRRPAIRSGFLIFQSTLPQGERRRFGKGVTVLTPFQSTLPQGERRAISLWVVAGFGFQSTLPQGERHHIKFRRPMSGYFNPRSRKGSDIFRHSSGTHLYHFNPRSRKGSDGMYIKGIGTIKKFQSTLPQGERLHPACDPVRHIEFQSTLPQGERRQIESVVHIPG